MKRQKILAGIFGLILLSLTFMGCNVSSMSPEPFDVPTPLPVTPMAPPEGIRQTLSMDPRHLMMQEEPPRMTDAAMKYAPTVIHADSNLRLCDTGSSYADEAFSEADEQFKGMVVLEICGWKRRNKPVEVRIVGSDGATLHADTVTTGKSFYQQPSNIASIIHQIDVAEQSTTVLVEFVGEDGLFSAEHTITLPTEPRLYTYPTGDVWLYGFEVGEQVQLLRYDVSERGYVQWESGGGITETYTLVDVATMTVEANGTLFADSFAGAGYGTFGPESMIHAVGAKTGELGQGQMGFTVQGSVFE